MDQSANDVEHAPADSERIGHLDGLRGMAAFWVLAGHTCILTQYNIPLLSKPNFAVDLFMLISGFLMQYQATIRSHREPFDAPSSWVYFWIRRFLRLSPVYYLTLFIAIVFGTHFGAWRGAVANLFPETATEMARYADGSWSNVLIHVSYLFGFSPAYSFRTALPDWSIGLEMQFYMLFPFLYLVASRIGFIPLSIGAAVLTAILWLAVPAFLRAFAEPAFLPLKINLFIAGMVISASMFSRNPWWLFAGALTMAALPLDGIFSVKTGVIRVICAAALGGLSLYRKLSLPPVFTRLGDAVTNALSNRFCFWFGELSYGAYLIHLLILLPIAATVNSWDMSPRARFAFCLASVTILTYVLSRLIFSLVENPGRSLGRKLITVLKNEPAKPVTEATGDFPKKQTNAAPTR